MGTEFGYRSFDQLRVWFHRPEAVECRFTTVPGLERVREIEVIDDVIDRPLLVVAHDREIELRGKGVDGRYVVVQRFFVRPQLLQLGIGHESFPDSPELVRVDAVSIADLEQGIEAISPLPYRVCDGFHILFGGFEATLDERVSGGSGVRATVIGHRGQDAVVIEDHRIVFHFGSLPGVGLTTYLNLPTHGLDTEVKPYTISYEGSHIMARESRAEAVTDGGTDRSAEPWRVGTATRNITPEKSMWMSGWAAREEPSEGVEQDLYARIVALEDERGNRSVIGGLEVLFVPSTFRQSVATRCEREYGLDPDGLLLNASHTHCGPVIRDERARMYQLDENRSRQVTEYRDQLEETVVSLVGEALESMEPARLSYGHARCGFAMNRRLPTPDGIDHVPNPDGPVDHDVPVLVAERGDTIRAIVFGYACHATTMKHHLKFGGDWPGFAQSFLEEAHPDATALFLTGCAGDQNPYPRGPVRLAREYGRSLANAVEAAITARRRPVHGPLRSVYEVTQVPFEEAPSREGLEELLESDDHRDRIRARALLNELDETGTIATEHPYQIQALGFGSDLTLVAFAGEVLADYALALKRDLPGPLWVAAYSNADFGYVPTAVALTEGGYEADGAFKYTTYPGRPTERAEERILSTARVAASRVRGP